MEGEPEIPFSLKVFYLYFILLANPGSRGVSGWMKHDYFIITLCYFAKYTVLHFPPHPEKSC